MRGGHVFHPRQCLDAALRLTRLGGLGAKTLDEAFQMRALALLLFKHRLLHRQLGGALALEIRIAASVELEHAGFDMDDMGDHRVEKIAVVRDQQQRAWVALEPAFQPDHRVQIEVVGGLVQQQQIGAAHQRLRQIQAHAPATGKCRHRLGEVRVGKAQAVQQLGGAGARTITVDLAQTPMQFAHQMTVIRSAGGGQIALHLAQHRIAVEREFERRLIQRRGLLRHVRDHPAGRHEQVARFRMQLAQQQREQAGLARAVGAGQADFLARVDLHAGVLDQDFGGAGEGELTQADHDYSGNKAKAALYGLARQASFWWHNAGMLKLLKQLHQPQVRDLAWVMAAPGLLRESAAPDFAVPDAFGWQAAHTAMLTLLELDQVPVPLLDWIAARNPQRLGRYFETLLEYWLVHLLGGELLAANLKVKADKRVVGEYDFIWRDAAGTLQHWEASVKFYLQVDAGAGLAGYIGTLTHDRLDLKFARLRDHQLKLGGTLAGAAVLPNIGEIPVARALLKGWLFYPAGQTMRPAPDVSPQHLQGWWLRWDATAQLPQTGLHWRVLERLEWLTPAMSRSGVELQPEIDFSATLNAHFSAHGVPLLVSGMALQESIWQEVSRGFVVSAQWNLDRQLA